LANKRVSELAPITAVELTAADLVLLADVTAHESKKLTLGDLGGYLLSGGNLTGSFFGTASYANIAGVANSILGSNVVGTVSSASHAITASYALNSSGIGVTSGGSYNISASWASSSLSASYILGSGVKGIVQSASLSTFAGIAYSSSYLIYSVNNGSASYAATSSHALNSTGIADTASVAHYLLYSGTNNGTASHALYAAEAGNANYTTLANYANNASNAIYADTAGTALIGVTINFQSSASWASSSISSSYARNSINAINAETASYVIGNAADTTYGVFTAITQSITSSQVDVVTLTANSAMTASFEVKGTLIVPYTASIALSESVTLHLLNRTTGVDQVLDMSPVYYFMGNTSTFVGTISGLFVGSVLGTVTGSVDGTITGSTIGTVTGSVNGQITGSITGSISGSDFGTGSIDGSVTSSINGTLTGSFDGQSTGSINGSVTGSISGSVTGSMNGTMTGTITNLISGSFTIPFGLMGSYVVLPDEYMLYAVASSTKIHFASNRLSKFGIDINVGRLEVSVGNPLAFYTDNSDYITFFSNAGGQFTDTAANMAISGSDQMLQVDLSGVSDGAHNMWTMTSMFYVSCSNANLLTSVSGMPASLLTMSFQTSSLTELKRLDNTSLTRLICTKAGLSAFPLLPTTMSNGYIDFSQNVISTLPDVLPYGLTELYIDSNAITSPPLNFPSSVVSMSLSNNPNLSTWTTTLPSSLVWFWCRDNSPLASLPTIPSSMKYLDVSYNSLTDLVQDSCCADLVTNGVNGGTLDLRGNASLLPVTLTRIATLQSRAWTVNY